MRRKCKFKKNERQKKMKTVQKMIILNDEKMKETTQKMITLKDKDDMER